jgi:hypothetical protein
MTFAKRTDRNHKEICQALKKAGFSVQDLSRCGQGVPDILVGCGRSNLLMEIKTEEGQLNERQIAWHAAWRGPHIVVRTVKEAIDAAIWARATTLDRSPLERQ